MHEPSLGCWAAALAVLPLRRESLHDCLCQCICGSLGCRPEQDVLWAQNTYFGELTWMFCVLVLLMMVGRAVFVFPLTLFHNLLAAEERISMKDAVVIW